jgi:hypothetical protein
MSSSPRRMTKVHSRGIVTPSVGAGKSMRVGSHYRGAIAEQRPRIGRHGDAGDLVTGEARRSRRLISRGSFSSQALETTS